MRKLKDRLRSGADFGLAQGGSIMPRLNELGGGVSSAEETLQDINQRLESADSKLGEGGASTAAALPGLFPGGVKLPEVNSFFRKL